MELIGTLEPDAAVATREAEWIHVIETHPQLSAVEAKGAHSLGDGRFTPSGGVVKRWG